MSEFIAIIPIVFFLCLEGLFSGGEIALVAADITKMRQKANAGSRSAQIALKLRHKPAWFLSTTLTGTNLSEMTNTALATAFCISFFGIEKGAVVSIFIMIPLVVIMGEIVPKSIFQYHADAIAPKIACFIWVVSWVFYPVILILSKISSGAVYMFSQGREVMYSSYITKSGLESLLHDKGDTGDIKKSERKMIQKIFDFADTTVEEIMVPLSNVSALPALATLEEAALFVAEKRFSRIPIYSDQMFNIIGILHTFDLSKALLLQKEAKKGSLEKEGKTVGCCMREKVLYVPETKQASELFFELQQQREHMAVIVDEYGGAVGIITVEDILEEIVGEIDDEYHDTDGLLYRKIGPGRFLVNAQIKIEQLQELFSFDVPEGDYETLAGFLLFKKGRVLKRYETYRHGEVLFVVEDADIRSIKKVMIVVPGINKLNEKSPAIKE